MTTMRDSFSRMQQSLTGGLTNVAQRTIGHVGIGLRAVFGNYSQRSFGVLMYHRVLAPIQGVLAPPFNVVPQRFREQITGLIECGFTFRSLPDVLVSARRGNEIPPRTVVLTFDDCHASVYANAWPILRESQVPFTLFLATAYLDQAAPFPFDRWGNQYRKQLSAVATFPLSGEQISEMLASGLATIGTHTHTHTDFRGRIDDFENDLRLSVKVLRERFHLDELPFAFPYGSPRKGFATAEMKERVRRVDGLTCSLTTAYELVDPTVDSMSWGRLTVYPWDSAATLAGALDGWRTWAYKFRSRRTA